MTLHIGLSGFGGKDEAEDNLRIFAENGIKACEIAYTYSVYLKKPDAERIGKLAKELNIELSIHAPYFINLNSKEPEKRESSKKRVLACCESAHHLQCKKIIIHPGYYLGDSPEQTTKNVIKIIKELQEEIKKNKWDVNLCLETMGKNNVFGSLEEIKNVVNETGCSFCIDFAHVLARYKEHNLEEIKNSFPQEKWHCHFSGIQYGEKGEQKHLRTTKEDWKRILDFLKKNKKNATVICESPDPFNDALMGINLF
jgi:deoxyribonuclease IV